MPAKNLMKSKVAYGLDWKPLTTDNINSEALAVGKSSRRSLGAFLIGPEDSGWAQIGLTNDTKSRGALSAAGIFADLISDGLIIESYSPSRFWICLVIDGKVVPGFDILLSEDDARRKVSDFFDQEFEASLDSLSIFGDQDSSALVVTLFGENTEYEIASLEDLIERSGGSFPKSFSHLRIKPLSGNKLGIIAGAAIVVAVAGYVSNGSNVFTPSAETEEIDLSGLQSMKAEEDEKKTSIIDLEKTRQQRLNEAIKIAAQEEARWIQEDFSERSGVPILSQILDRARNSLLVKSGWKLSSIQYDHDRQLQSYDRRVSVFGTPVQFVETFGKSAQIDMSGASGKIPFDVQGYEYDADPMAFINGFKGDKTLPKLMTDLSSKGLKWSLSEADTGKRRETSEEVDDIDPDKSDLRQLKYTKRNIKVTGSSLISLEALQSVFEKHPSVVAKNVLIKFDKGIAWEFNGDFYEF